MTRLAATARPIGASSPADWRIPAGLLALTFIPVAGGILRVTTLPAHSGITPDTLRFFAAPIPVLLRSVSVTI